MYVDAILDRKTDKIHIAERCDGQRVLRDIPATYTFYYEDASGTHRSIYGHPCRKSSTTSTLKFRAALKEHRGKRIFESDLNPVFSALARDYARAEAPVLHVGFFDIEAGFDQERGFAPPGDPFNPITAITLYRTADQRLLSYVLRPPGHETAQEIVDSFTDTYLFDDENLLLLAFIDAIEDVDCFTGWNSSYYDVPYLINRIRRLVGMRTASRLCLWGYDPSPREYSNKFGRKIETYDLIGRVHLDYLDLYAKHNQQQRLSYALNAIGEAEVGETKVAYSGTLDDLYNKDFPTFIEYNRQDVMLMVKIDQKLRFIDLANQIAHANGVLLKTTMGSVALVEQAIINDMHAMNAVVPNRKHDADIEEVGSDSDDEDDEAHSPVVGAYVAQPKKGLHDNIACVDINSLYPSTIRALNMSPETLVAQVRPEETMRLIRERTARLPATQHAEAWDGIFETVEVSNIHAQDDTVLTVDFFNMLTDETISEKMTGKELYQFVFDPQNHVCITANGTLFRTDVEGIIPRLLAKWYAERKELQAKQKLYETLASGIDIDALDDHILNDIGHRDDLIVQDNKLMPEDAAARASLLELASYWNRCQLAGKIRLNATYGALLNEVMRFFDQRIGQSTTLSGRTIVRHMNAKINEIITGEYDYHGDAILYSDTDSSYFSAYHILKDEPAYAEFVWSRENIIDLYDAVADAANLTFPKFMVETFNTSIERGGIIRAGRELVACKGLFIKKKKYAVLMFDKEGQRLDVGSKPGKLKAMGLDLKRADTPRFMQEFLEKLLMSLLTGASEEEMFGAVKTFREAFKARPGWEKGTPKKVANLSQFSNKLKEANDKGLDFETILERDANLRINMPGHVRASLNWNRLCELNNDRYATRISDSGRIIVCKLCNNTIGMTSIAYPIDDLPQLPIWFKELPFDDEAMEETIIDNKIMNLCGVLDWDLTKTKQNLSSQFFSWSG